MNVYDFTVRDKYGRLVSLRDYEGKGLLIVNTATRCGFTPQYDGLQDLYERFKGEGFELLDFPCDQFDHQAPGTAEEIASFCDAHFGIKFRQFGKLEVNGENENPLYTFLKQEQGFKGFDEENPITPLMVSKLEREHPDYKETPDIKWNFTKFLIDRSGNVVARFEPTSEPADIEDELKKVL